MMEMKENGKMWTAVRTRTWTCPETLLNYQTLYPAVAYASYTKVYYLFSLHI